MVLITMDGKQHRASRLDIKVFQYLVTYSRYRGGILKALTCDGSDGTHYKVPWTELDIMATFRCHNTRFLT
jgi:hypothetical protein